MKTNHGLRLSVNFVAHIVTEEFIFNYLTNACFLLVNIDYVLTNWLISIVQYIIKP